jgi:hypothetical protein
MIELGIGGEDWLSCTFVIHQKSSKLESECLGSRTLVVASLGRVILLGLGISGVFILGLG